MSADGWWYYNHAMLPVGSPGCEVNLEPIKDGSIWKNRGGYVLFARWISDYDCGYPTEWWYCLKDDEYDIDKLNSKKRYRITRGRRYFDVKIVNPADYVRELMEITKKAYSEYSEEYRPNISEDVMIKTIHGWEDPQIRVFGAFSKETSELCGFSLVKEHEDYCFLVQQKVDPPCEKNEINAALVDGVVLYYEDRIQYGYPIVDGQRNVVHETGFQDYLCRIFGFRKAYCRLNIKYRSWVWLAVKVLYPFRNILAKCHGNLFHQINSVMLMETISRSYMNRKSS